MQLTIVSVFDRAAQAHMSINAVPTPALAVRGFTDEINSGSEKSALSAHPEDFELYSLGTVDTDTGVITPQVSLIVRAQDLKRPQNS